MDQNGIDAIINDVSDQAAAWYSILTGKPVPVMPGQQQTPAQAAPTPVMTPALASAVVMDYGTLVTVGVILVAAVLLLRH